MAYYSELATVNDVRSVYLSIVGTTDDALLLDMLRDASRRIQRMADRAFVPRIETRYYDPTRDLAYDKDTLLLDRDYLAFTTITNGDAIAVATDEYVTAPRQDTPYWAVQLLGSGGKSWTYQTNPENAITIAGVTGYHDEYTDAWAATDTLNGAISSTSAVTFTTSGSALLKGGNLIKIDSEYLYVSSVSTVTPTVVRGVNGSTAATHLTLAAISVWQPVYEIKRLACEVVAALYRLRANPIAENFVALDGVTTIRPRDVDSYIMARLRGLGLVRNGL